MAHAKPALSLWIAENRKRLGWKADELAARLRAAGYEAADTTVRTWEAGRRPSPDTIIGLERLFDAPAPRDEANPADLAAAIAALATELRLDREERRQEWERRLAALELAVDGLVGRAIGEAQEPAAPRARAG